MRIRAWLSRYENRRLAIGFLRTIGWTALFLAVLWGLLHLPVVSVRSVEVVDQSTTDGETRAEVIAFLADLMDEYRYGVRGSTRYFFKREEVADLVRSRFLKVGSIDIDAVFFNRWVVTVTGRKTFGTFCARDDDCYLIDPFGVMFSGTTLPVGVTIRMAGDIRVGEAVFGSDADAWIDFNKITEAVRFLSQYDLVVREVSVRRDSRVVHVQLQNGVGIWIDASESLYDTTRALYIVFERVFIDDDRRSVVSVDVRNPLNILYEKR